MQDKRVQGRLRIATPSIWANRRRPAGARIRDLAQLADGLTPGVSTVQAALDQGISSQSFSAVTDSER